MSKLKTAQELIKTNNSSVMAGFNMFIHGHPPITFADGYHDTYDRMQGYEYAQKMAKEDGIAFTKVFKCKQGDCHPFQYGGFFVCNNCGQFSCVFNQIKFNDFIGFLVKDKCFLFKIELLFRFGNILNFRIVNLVPTIFEYCRNTFISF